VFAALARSIPPLALALLALLAPLARAAPGDSLLPNLHPLPASDARLVQDGARLLLRFTMSTQNLGAGPLDLRASGSSPLPAPAAHRLRLPLLSLRAALDALARAAARQRVYLEGGGYRERPAGDFVFHPTHEHVHFEDFALYDLVRLDGPDGRAVTSKVTFCIVDAAVADLSLPGAPPGPAYTTCGTAPGIADVVQGISVGWGDFYDYNTPGQELDVTGLPDGLYALRITADPLARLEESDRADNTSQLRLRLTAGALTPP
jgi:hypothetical protein